MRSNATTGIFTGFGTLGSPDIIAVVNGRFIGIEVKGTSGKQSEAQKDFQMRLEAAGGMYILATCVDKVEQALS